MMVRGKGLLTARAQSEDPLHGQAGTEHLAEEADPGHAEGRVVPQPGIREGTAPARQTVEPTER